MELTLQTPALLFPAVSLLLLAYTTVPADALMHVLTDQPKGSQTITGEGRVLEVEVRRNEVRRNEVWLVIGGPDAAVGPDDLMDAVAGALPSA